MKYWVATDSHLGHSKMGFIEAFGRVPDFESRVLKGLSLVGPEDVLIHLGDLCWGHENDWHDKLWSACKAKHKWLCLGNHDSKSMSWYLNHGWDFVCSQFELNIFGKRILFSHKPQPFSGYDLNIHGHFHTAPEDKHEKELVAIKNNRHYLLTAELEHYQPVNLRTLVDKYDRENRGK